MYSRTVNVINHTGRVKSFLHRKYVCGGEWKDFEFELRSLITFVRNIDLRVSSPFFFCNFVLVILKGKSKLF